MMTFILVISLLVVGVITLLSVYAIKKGYSKEWDKEEDDGDLFK